MKVLAFSESIFSSTSKGYLDGLFQLLWYNKTIFLLIPLKIKLKEFISNIKREFPSEDSEKFIRVMRKMNAENRLIRIQVDNESFCSTVESKAADYHIYNDSKAEKTSYSEVCRERCLAVTYPNNHEIKTIDSFQNPWPTITEMDFIPGESTLDDLGKFLKHNIIRFTQNVEILDPYVGKNIEMNDYSLPPTLKLIYTIFKDNIKFYQKFWKGLNPLFTIRTIGDLELQRKLEKLDYVRIEWYNCRQSEFPHDRFLKTEYLLTLWGSGFDVFDSGSKFRGTGITIVNKKRYPHYKKQLKNIRIRSY